MRNSILAFSLLVSAFLLGSCMHSTMQQGSSTLQLSSRSISLSGNDTISSVHATLSCGCPFHLESMTCWGDTNAIHFNTQKLGSTTNDQEITATAMPKMCEGRRALTAHFAFAVNDQMMKSMCRDTITVNYLP